MVAVCGEALCYVATLSVYANIGPIIHTPGPPLPHVCGVVSCFSLVLTPHSCYKLEYKVVQLHQIYVPSWLQVPVPGWRCHISSYQAQSQVTSHWSHSAPVSIVTMQCDSLLQIKQVTDSSGVSEPKIYGRQKFISAILAEKLNR